MAHIRYVGVDEVGRGPLAGPVTVCAVAVPPSFDMRFFMGITDSKQMTATTREEWAKRLHTARAKGTLDYAVRSVHASAIDTHGISAALRKAVRLALYNLQLNTTKSRIFLDGSLYAPKAFIHQQTIIRGDQSHKLISAASVIAKVHRDTYMRKVSEIYPKYGFSKHKGYGTKEHQSAISRHGLSAEHRKSFCKRIPHKA